ncbi:serine O-acetyltransferase [Tatumella ptyseos]|nr:serine acetyltransferase [Tatumella ptyseos]SQK72186.1 Serine acetyltransferase [Tatumella ptyseos]
MLWDLIREQAVGMLSINPRLSDYLNSYILDFDDFNDALAFHVAENLGKQVRQIDIESWFSEVLAANPSIYQATEKDILKLVTVNPACPDELTGLLTSRGIIAAAAQRISHCIYLTGDIRSAALVQSWIALQMNIDIHPAAVLGAGLFIDHGIGIVIGETAIVEDDVSIWHGVTLGSTLREAGDRHPKIRRGALLCAGASVLGNIEIGEGAIVAANAVVTKTVPAKVIVAGCPGKVLGAVPDELNTLTSKTVKNKEFS